MINNTMMIIGKVIEENSKNFLVFLLNSSLRLTRRIMSTISKMNAPNTNTKVPMNPISLIMCGKGFIAIIKKIVNKGARLNTTLWSFFLLCFFSSSASMIFTSFYHPHLSLTGLLHFSASPLYISDIGFLSF